MEVLPGSVQVNVTLVSLPTAAKPVGASGAGGKVIVMLNVRLAASPLSSVTV